MDIAIVYKSITGNTKIIAEAIKESIEDNNIVYFGEAKKDIEADLYIVGSWTDKGNCTKEIAEFLSQLNNKKVAYFGTAGFGGTTEYYETIYNRVKKNINESNILLGYFYCQGKMPLSIKNKYEQLIKANPEDKNLQVSIKNFEQALKHPDNEDIENAKIWINTILNAYE